MDFAGAGGVNRNSIKKRRSGGEGSRESGKVLTGTQFFDAIHGTFSPSGDSFIRMKISERNNLQYRPAFVRKIFRSLFLILAMGWSTVLRGEPPVANSQPATTIEESFQKVHGEDLKRLPVRRQGRLRQILDRKVLLVGMQRDYQPFHVEHAREGYPGIDVELARLLAGSLGVEMKPVYLPLEELLRAVDEGRLDLSLGGISSNLTRARYVNFSNPYIITSSSALLARRVLPPESEGVDFPKRNFESLADLRYLGVLNLGVKADTTNERLLRSDPEFERHKIIVFPDHNSQLDALQNGKIDALVADGIYLKALLLRRSDLLNRFLPLMKTYRQEHISMALPPGDMEYLYYINFFIKEIRRTGHLHRILNRYFDSNAWIPDESEKPSDGRDGSDPQKSGG